MLDASGDLEVFAVPPGSICAPCAQHAAAPSSDDNSDNNSIAFCTCCVEG